MWIRLVVVAGSLALVQAEGDNFAVLRPIEFVTLFVLGIFGGVLPIFLLRRSRTSGLSQAQSASGMANRWHSVLSCGMVFSGGILLGVAFLHMLPEAREILTEAHHEEPSAAEGHHHDDSVSLADTLCLATLLGLFLLENGSMALVAEKSANRNRHMSIVSYQFSDEGDRASEDRGDHVFEPPAQEIQTHSALDTPLVQKDAQAHHGHSHAHLAGSGSLFSTVFLWALLIAHSILEGIALGLSNHYSGQISLFVAIASHKAFEAFALGSCLAKSPLRTPSKATLLVLFALSSPIGGILGAYAINTSSERAGGIAAALASGTFIYVGLLEIVTEEFSKPCGLKLLGCKCLALVLGCVIIGVLRVWT
eukprot:c11326_g1_i1.p1 GENE.c11326_g1_i1~~c11326_g1_i1.p1  ORF type:complete len:365 (-),score=70.17 c11326_g1_i1:39-1133(-)